MLLRDCTVTGGEIADPLTHAVVVSNGDSPKATVSISVPVDRRHVRVDQVLDATIRSAGKAVVIEGRSAMLEREVGLAPSDSKVTYRVVHKGGCKECAK